VILSRNVDQTHLDPAALCIDAGHDDLELASVVNDGVDGMVQLRANSLHDDQGGPILPPHHTCCDRFFGRHVVGKALQLLVDITRPRGEHAPETVDDWASNRRLDDRAKRGLHPVVALLKRAGFDDDDQPSSPTRRCWRSWRGDDRLGRHAGPGGVRCVAVKPPCPGRHGRLAEAKVQKAFD